MLKSLNNDSKMQMRLNIKRHRQKLLQYLEKTNDTFLKPKIKLISNNLEKSNLNHNLERKTISSITVNQLQPNIKVNKQDEPLSNAELKLVPLPNIKIINSKPPPVVLKKLKEQLIEELYYSSSSEESDDDNISVGNNEDWNENFQTHNENDSNNSSIIEEVKYYGQEQLADDKSKENYMYSSSNNNNHVLDINYSSPRKRLIMIPKKDQTKIEPSKPKFRKGQARAIHNAKERECRSRIAKRFQFLKKQCSYLNPNRRASKVSILLAAKKECDLLLHFSKKMATEKELLIKSNERSRKRLHELLCRNSNHG